MTQNIKIELDAESKIATIIIDYSGQPSESSTGKTMIYASTQGNQKIGDELILGLNLYRKK